MERISRSFRLERGSSLRLGRSNSLVSELVSSEIANITAYERLSESMSLPGEPACAYRRRRKNRGWAFLSQVFSFRKIGGNQVIGRPAAESPPKTLQPAVVTTEKEKKKRSSSWLPDPHRRWPVQGW